MVASSTIKKDSADWLTGALDPFHDFNYTPEGLPDQYSGSSCVQFIKQKRVFTKPAGITGDWDLHIFSVPTMSSGIGRIYSNVTPGKADQARNANNISGMGTLTFFATPAGTSALPTGSGAGFVNPTGSLLVANSPCDNGNTFSLMRLIGGGFEVHNDTAPMYRKGAVTVYSQPSELQDRFMRMQVSDASIAAGNTFSNSLNVSCFRLPPSDVNLATTNVNARTWSAEEGCYVPFQLNMNKTSFQMATANPLVGFTVDNSADYAATTSGWGSELDPVAAYSYQEAIGPVVAGNIGTEYLRPDQPLRLCNIQTVGAYFTGLSPETVLTIDIRFIVEIAPTPANTTLVSLATPSAQYDPTALELYSRAIRELPPGVKVSMNAAGDWWKVISGTIKAVAPVASAFGPYGKAVSMAATGLAALGDAAAEKRARKRLNAPDKGRAGTSSPSLDREKKPKKEKKTATDKVVDTFLKTKFVPKS